jgi:hypothetical protein
MLFQWFMSSEASCRKCSDVIALKLVINYKHKGAQQKIQIFSARSFYTHRFVPMLTDQLQERTNSSSGKQRSFCYILSRNSTIWLQTSTVINDEESAEQSRKNTIISGGK